MIHAKKQKPIMVSRGKAKLVVDAINKTALDVEVICEMLNTGIVLMPYSKMSDVVRNVKSNISNVVVV